MNTHHEPTNPNRPDAPEAEYQSEWPDLGDGLGGIDVSIEREDGQPARIAVNVTYDGEWTFALLDAETARQVADHLLHCADRIDSTPYRKDHA